MQGLNGRIQTVSANGNQIAKGSEPDCTKEIEKTRIYFPIGMKGLFHLVEMESTGKGLETGKVKDVQLVSKTVRSDRCVVFSCESFGGGSDKPFRCYTVTLNSGIRLFHLLGCDAVWCR